MVARTVTVNVIGNADSAKKALDDTAGKAEQSSGKISGLFKGVLGNMKTMAGDALGPVVEGVDKLSEAFDRAKEHGGKIAGAMAGIGTAAVGVGGMLTALGSKEQASTQQLKQAIENAGGSYDDFKDRIEKTIKTNERFGHTSADTQEAIRKLTQATNDTGKSLKEMSIVSDMAASKHISLSAAAGLLAKAHGGSAKVLKEFGIDITKAADNTKQLAAAQKVAEAADLADKKAKEALVMLHERLAGKTHLTVSEQQSLTKAQEAVVAADGKATEAHRKLADMHVQVTSKAAAADENITKLGDKLKGQASAASNTFMGHLKALGVTFEDQAAKIGQKYGPAIMGAGTAVDALAGIMRMFSGSAAAGAAAGDAAAASETSMGVAGDAAAPGIMATLGPIVLIVAAVAALAFGIYELVTHWKDVWGAIKDAVDSAWKFITGVFDDVVGWFKRNWQNVLVGILTGPFGLAIKWLTDNFDILGFIKDLPGKIENALAGLGHILAFPFLWAWNQIAKLWNDTVGTLNFKIPSWVPFIGGDSFGMPTLPTIQGFAQGGIVPGPLGMPQLAIVHGGEEVVPAARVGSGRGAAGAGTVTIVVPLKINDREFARATAFATWDELVRQGKRMPTGVLPGTGAAV